MADDAPQGDSGNVWLDSILLDTRWAGGPPGGPTVIDVHIAGRDGQEDVEQEVDGEVYAVTATPPDPAEVRAMRAAMAAFEAVCAVDFRAAPSQRDADLVWASVTDEGAFGDLGWADFPGSARSAATGEALSVVAVNYQGYGQGRGPDALRPGGDDFVTFIHELGHAVGLAHPHDDGGGSTVMPGVDADEGDVGDVLMNQGVFTMMSYNSGWPGGPGGLGPSRAWGYEGGPMALDVAALQFIYGANPSTGAGDDTYRLPGSNGVGTSYSCIWDAGGSDRVVGTGRADVIDLRAASLDYAPGGGGWVSHARGVNGGFTIAHRAAIEDAAGGAGDDAVRGNGGANRLAGGAGDDRLWGGGGDDRLLGGAGKDRLHGGGGRDDFVFKAAADSVGAGRDVVADFARGRDALDLAALDARAGVAGGQAFVLDAGGAFSQGEVRQRRSGDDLFVAANLDGDGDAELSILLLDVAGRLGASDFVL